MPPTKTRRQLPSPFFGALGLWFVFSPPFGPTASFVFLDYEAIEDVVLTGRIAMMVLFILSCFFFIAFDNLSLKAKEATIAVCAVVCSAGMVLMALPALGGPADLLIAGSALRGAADGVALLAWITLLSKLRGRDIGIALAESVFVYALAITIIPEVAYYSKSLAGVLLAACPLTSALGCIIVAKQTHDPSEPSNKQEPLSPQYQLIFIANNVLYGYIFGIMQCEVFRIHFHLASAALVIFSLFLVIIFAVHKQSSDYGRGFRVYSVAAAIGLLVCALLGDSAPLLSNSLIVILWGLQIFFNLMIFTDVQFTAVGYSINSGSVGLGTLGLGILFATLLPFGDLNTFDLTVYIAATFVTLVYTNALFLPRKGRWTSNWGFSSYSLPESEESFRSRRSKEVADEFRLTKRESEVAQLLSQGMSSEDISKQLFISPLTTKTHIRNMYAKMDVHSQSEFIDLLDNGRIPSE